MGIPESQLDTWAHQGSVIQSRDTYATVKRALEASSAGYADKEYEIFLQGSYGNDTNIYSESDVDVVIRLDSTFYYDVSALSPEAQAAFHSYTGGAASYSCLDFKHDVVSALQSRFATDVAVGKKAVMIAASGNRRKADVIAATAFRRYRSFSSYRTDDYEPGICFFTDTGERIVNYPRQHSANLTARHQATNKWLKPTVRILKNMRRRMEAEGLIPVGLAPSYFLEGLLYNVPSEKFGASYENTIVNALNWVIDADRSKFVCANEEYYLLRNVAHVCWTPSDCDTFLEAVEKFWKDWH